MKAKGKGSAASPKPPGSKAGPCESLEHADSTSAHKEQVCVLRVEALQSAAQQASVWTADLPLPVLQSLHTQRRLQLRSTNTCSRHIAG